MLERLIIVVLVAAAVFVLTLAVRHLARRRTASRLGQTLPARLRDRMPRGAPSVLYFFGPHCPSCRQQVRVLDGLETEIGIGTLRLDAVEESEAAAWLGIMTVPSSVIVGSDGAVQQVLPGFQPASALRPWLQQVTAQR